MARGLLSATMYIEDQLTKEEWNKEEEEKIKEFTKNWKSFKEPPRKKAKLAEQLNDEIETSTRLLIEYAGFEEIDPKALERLKNVFHQRLIQTARQFSAAERRRKDGLEMPYKSPLEWTLKLAGIGKVIEIREWYDVTYWQRFRRLKQQFEERINGK